MYTSLLIATVLLPNIFRGGTNSAPIDKPPTKIKRISLGHLVAVSGDGRSQNQISYRHVENLDRIPAILMHPNPVPLWYAMVDGPFTQEYPTFTLPDALEVERNRAYATDDFSNDDFDDEFEDVGGSEQKNVVTNSDGPAADTDLIEQSQREIDGTTTEDSSKTNRSKPTISESDLVEDLPGLIDETPKISTDDRGIELMEDPESKIDSAPGKETPKKSEDNRGIDLVENSESKIVSASVEETPKRSEDHREIDIVEDTKHKIDSAPVDKTPKKFEDDRGIDLVENLPHKIDSTTVEETPQNTKDDRGIDLVENSEHKVDSAPVQETPQKTEDNRRIDLVKNVPHKIDSANVEEIPNKPKANREIELVEDIDHKTTESAKETSFADNHNESLSKKSDTSMDNLDEKNTQSPKCPDNISRQTFHNPDDSKSFLICNDGNLFKMNCPSTLIFNSALKLCDWPTP